MRAIPTPGLDEETSRSSWVILAPSLRSIDLLVVAGYVAQGGALADSLPWLLSVPLALSILPSITLAGIPDREADASTGKGTLAVRWGRAGAARFAIVSTIAAAAAPVLPALLVHPQFAWTMAPAAIHAVFLCRGLRRYLRDDAPAGRIDSLLVLALSYMMWFVVVPLIVLLMRP